MGMMVQEFAELVKIGDFLDEGIKSGKIQSMAALQVASRAIQSGSLGSAKKKKENISIVAPYYQHGESSSRYPNNPQIVAHTPYIPYPVYNAQPHYNPPRGTARQNPPKTYPSV